MLLPCPLTTSCCAPPAPPFPAAKEGGAKRLFKEPEVERIGVPPPPPGAMRAEVGVPGAPGVEAATLAAVPCSAAAELFDDKCVIPGTPPPPPPPLPLWGWLWWMEEPVELVVAEVRMLLEEAWRVIAGC